MQNIQVRPAPRKTLSKRQRFQILKRDGFRCRYCGAGTAESNLQLDHIVPLSKGGPDHRCNLLTACSDCNYGKGSDHVLSPSGPLLHESAIALASYHSGSAVSERYKEWFSDLFLAEVNPWFLLDEIQPGRTIPEMIEAMHIAAGYPA